MFKLLLFSVHPELSTHFLWKAWEQGHTPSSSRLRNSSKHTAHICCDVGKRTSIKKVISKITIHDFTNYDPIVLVVTAQIACMFMYYYYYIWNLLGRHDAQY